MNEMRKLMETIKKLDESNSLTFTDGRTTLEFDGGSIRLGRDPEPYSRMSGEEWQEIYFDLDDRNKLKLARALMASIKR